MRRRFSARTQGTIGFASSVARFEKYERHYLSLVDLASTLIVYRIACEHSRLEMTGNVLEVFGYAL